jgi:hypothetical protein
MAASLTSGPFEVEPEPAPVASVARIRPNGDEAWSADDDAAAEIAASASYEPSVVSDRIAD